MRDDELDRALVRDVMENVFVPRAEVETILEKHRTGILSRDAAESALRALNQDESPLGSEISPTAREWHDLLTAMQTQSNTAQGQARRQSAAAFYNLAGMLLLAALCFFVPAGAVNSAGRAAVVISVIAGGVSSSFVLMRLLQQAVTAEERLHEKQVAVHFLRVAIAAHDENLRKELISAGTTMFLGHYAPVTLPLQPADKPASLS